MGKITIGFCLAVLCLLAGVTQTLAACPEYTALVNGACLPTPGYRSTDKPSSPSDETLNTGRYKPAKKLGVHPSGSQSSTPSGEQVCPKGYTGTPPNCSPPTMDGKKIIFF